MQLIHYPHHLLYEPIPEFNFENNKIDTKLLEKNMLEIMFKENGIGLAANQVGLSYRMFVMGHKDNPHLGKAFFNPQIISIQDTIELEEGCLSFPNIFVKIKRPKKILAKWQNTEGLWEESFFEGYDCRCFLHEYDHLEGIVFKDRISSLKWNQSLKRLHKRK